MNIHASFLAKRRKPRFKLPPGATDAHCHVFGPAAKFPYAPGRRYTPEDAPKEMLRALHDHLGVERSVIVQASCHGTDNAAMLDCIASDPKRYRGVAIVDDSSPTRITTGCMPAACAACASISSSISAARPTWACSTASSPASSRAAGTWCCISTRPTSFRSRAMIRKLPLPFVIDHMGRVPAKDGVDQPPLRALLELSRLENCWIKVCGAERISMPPYDAAVPIAHALVEAAPERVLWGTDFPHPNATHEADEADLVDLVPQYAQDALAQKRLLVDNPARLYGFGA